MKKKERYIPAECQYVKPFLYVLTCAFSRTLGRECLSASDINND